MTTTTATKAVMRRLDSEDQRAERTVTFVLERVGTQVVERTLLLSYKDWVEMGSPDEVTMAVESGDTLSS